MFRHFHLIIRMVATLCVVTGVGGIAAHLLRSDSVEALTVQTSLADKKSLIVAKSRERTHNQPGDSDDILAQDLTSYSSFTPSRRSNHEALLLCVTVLLPETPCHPSRACGAKGNRHQLSGTAPTGFYSRAPPCRA